MRVSIIIPVLNEATVLQNNLQSLQVLREQGHEIIVVDGGSKDRSAVLADPLADQVLTSPPSRAIQMNTGAELANGDVFLFLHVDTKLPNTGITAITAALNKTQNSWGRFDVRLSGDQSFFRVIEHMINWRSRLSGIATGDQAIFVRRDVFQRIKGFSEIPLMEDVEICRRLRKITKPSCLTLRVTTSSRRWEQHGTFRTILLMWRLRLAYWFGADPRELARYYR
jgi:rSAM/selenodomain-associated transferase 2